MIFGREPARWIGLIAALILGVVTTLQGDGLVNDVLAGQVTELVHAAAQLAVLVAPMIAAEFIRARVTPVR
jgi:hypothetical protein